MAQPLELSQFDPEQPQAFYLPDDDVAALADATLVVGGKRLPVHRSVRCHLLAPANAACSGLTLFAWVPCRC